MAEIFGPVIITPSPHSDQHIRQNHTGDVIGITYVDGKYALVTLQPVITEYKPSSFLIP